jgi:hypothetical protein
MFIILKQLNISLHLLPFFQGLKLIYNTVQANVKTIVRKYQSGKEKP